MGMESGNFGHNEDHNQPQGFVDQYEAIDRRAEEVTSDNEEEHLPRDTREAIEEAAEHRSY